MGSARTTGFALVLSVWVAAPGAGCDRALQTQVPADAAQAVLSMQDIHCQSCGMEVAEALESTLGVHRVEFDRDTVEIRVAYDAAQTTPDAFVAVADGLGHKAMNGAGQGSYTPEVMFATELDVRQISKRGEAAELEPVAGKVTVFDFHAIWCGPCKKVDRHMAYILETHHDVALRKLNVSDWDSEVAKKFLSGVPQLPYVIVYGRKGRRVKAIAGLDLDALDAAITRGRKQ